MSCSTWFCKTLTIMHVSELHLRDESTNAILQRILDFEGGREKLALSGMVSWGTSLSRRPQHGLLPFTYNPGSSGLFSSIPDLHTCCLVKKGHPMAVHSSFYIIRARRSSFASTLNSFCCNFSLCFFLRILKSIEETRNTGVLQF